MPSAQAAARKSTRAPHHRSKRDPAPETKETIRLRKALTSAMKILRLPALVNAATAVKHPLDISTMALRDFMGNKSRNLLPHNSQKLESFLFGTVLGAALTDPTLKDASGARHLLDAILVSSHSGSNLAERGRTKSEVDGVYFACHGSYLHDEHFAIRLLTITSEANGTISFSDFIRDNKTWKKPHHEAHGTLTFFNGKPHLLAVGRDNAVGFRLIIGHDLGYGETTNSVAAIPGQMFGMTDKGLYFSRAIILRRIEGSVDRGTKRLRNQTGIFHASDRELEPHLPDLIELARKLPRQAFDDPILQLIAPPSNLQKLRTNTTGRRRKTVPPQSGSR